MTEHLKIKNFLKASEDAVASHAVNCWLWHRWSPWRDGATNDAAQNGIKVGVVTLQSRRCVKCNRLEMRYARALGGDRQ